MAGGDCGDERGAASASLAEAGDGGRGGWRFVRRRCVWQGRQGRQARPGEGCAGNGEHRAGGKPGLPALRQPRDRRLGPLGRAVAVSVQELRAHVQCIDQNAHGAPAQEGALARSRPRDDRGHEPGEDRETLRRPSDHRLPLAASVSPRACRRQASKLERNRRSG